jgi:hypothetical protein
VNPTDGSILLNRRSGAVLKPNHEVAPKISAELVFSSGAQKTSFRSSGSDVEQKFNGLLYASPIFPDQIATDDRLDS